MHNPLMDKDFLYALNQHRHKELYARIIALTFNESPLETIEGRVTSGSINIDGNSAVRRTCNLSLIAKDVNITDFYWGVSNKFTLEIGVKNTINEKYPDIIWFPQGIYVITSFNSALTNNNYTISIGGKDKMCLLNGDVGGSIPSSVDFGAMDVIKDVYSKIEFEDFSKYEANKYYIYDLDKKDYVISTESYDANTVYYTKDQIIEQKKITVKEIILQAVHTYGKEAYHNIIINDLDECGLELLQYRGDRELYLLYNEDISMYDQMTINGDYVLGKRIQPTDSSGKDDYTVSEIDAGGYNTAIDQFNSDRWIFQGGENTRYSVTKVSNKSEDNGYYDSSAIGYRVTELTYAGDLVCSIGDSLTSVLDKIKNMLGAFEYFYDLDGKFVFQAKRIYSNSSWNSLVETDGNIFARDAIEDSPYSYSFEDVNLIQKFTNTPSINNIKNDYSIWGTRESVSGAEIPIHARYAIDQKPTMYTSIEVTKDEASFLMSKFPELYLKLDSTQQESKRYVTEKILDTDVECDWREIIYQMALDYYKYNQWDEFSNKLIAANRADSLYLSGSTGYEQYYIDLQGFWRQLYNPNPEKIFDTEGGLYEEEKFYLVKLSNKEEFDANKQYYFTTDDERLIYVEVNDAEYDSKQEYYTLDKDNEFAEEYYRMGYRWDIFNQKDTFTCDFYLKPPSGVKDEDLDLTIYSKDKYYWNKNVVQAPSVLNFWFDFYEGDDSLQQYQVSYIGDRSKVVNDSKITSVYFRNVPQIIFMSPDESKSLDPEQRKTGYTYVFLTDEMADLFAISSRGKSAEEEMTELFNKYSYCTESITLTTIPIYHLEPNTLIHIRNDENGINGKYQISKITIPLSYNGTMSISATKVIDIV